MNSIKRIAVVHSVLALFFLSGVSDALAGTGCANGFSAAYPNSDTDNLGGCQTCHALPGGGNNFNRYGDELLLNGANGGGFNCNSNNVDFAAVLAAVEALDSDGEGNSNKVEIDASAQPGWCVAQNAGCMNVAGTPPNALLDPAPANGRPVANAGGPYSGEAGTTLIQFDGSASSDPDNDPLTYAWNFGDGNDGTGMMPTHTYAAAGNFTVTLIVNDSTASSDPGVTSAAISGAPVNLAPMANAGGPYAGQPGQPVTFDGSGSSDPNGDALTYAWDFGDGAMGSGATTTHSYAGAGTYTISLVVNDGEFGSPASTSVAEITDPIAQSDGQVLYNANCVGCHGDPWDGPAIDQVLAGLRRVAGARSCNISGSIFGTSVFPNGVPEMQFLQGLTAVEIEAMADYLNSRETSGERRYVTTCAGCHGDTGSGGRVGENVIGDSAGETREAIREESEMRYLACMPREDIDSIAAYLRGSGSNDDDDDDDKSDKGGGAPGLPFLVLLAIIGLGARMRRDRAE
jgi:mono/diheme cytochrome c family protein